MGDRVVGKAVSARCMPPAYAAPLCALLVICSALLLSSAAGAQSTQRYGYDGRGRLVEVRDGIGRKTIYGVDDADNRTDATGVRQFATFWEAEALPHVIGYADADGWAADVTIAPNFLTYGPYTQAIPAGSHVATWRMLIDVPDVADNSPVAILDVWDATAGQQLASRTLTRHEWAARFGHEVFELPFVIDTSRAGHAIELRTYYLGAAYLRVDKIGYYSNNDDTAPPPATTTCDGVSFAASNASVSEGGSLSFTMSKSGTTSDSCSINYATANNTAVAGSDYTAKSGTLTFSSSQTSLSVSVATTEDTTVENAETMYLDLSGASGGATISDSRGIGTISDDDTASAPSFSVSDASAVEGNSLVFTISKSGTTSGSYSVNYATANNTAIAGSDYTAKSGTLTFSSSQTSLSVSVATIDDASVEVPQTMYLNLSGASGGSTITDTQGLGTISDNDSSGGGGTCCQLQSLDSGEVDTLEASTSTDSTPTTTDSTSTTDESQPPPDPAEPPEAG